MAAQNWHQKWLTNAITSNQSGDLLYFARDPYGTSDDAVIDWDSFAAQFMLAGSGVTPLEIQNQAFTYAVDTGTANAYAVATTPDSDVYNDGAYICFKAAHSNTGASTMSPNTLSPVDILYNNDNPLVGGEILAGGTYMLVYNTTLSAYVLINPSNGVTSQQVQQQAFNYGTDIGAADAYVINLSPAISNYTDGLLLSFTPENTNITTTPTVNVNSMGNVSIILPSGENVSPGDLNSAILAYMIFSYEYGAFILLNPYVSYVSASDIQLQKFTYAIDTGSPNAIVLTLIPGVVSNGVVNVTFECANNNTGATTIDVGFGALPLITNAGALVGGELLAGGTYSACYNGTLNSYVLFNSSLSGGGGGVTAAQVQQSAFNYSTDTGTANAYVATLSPAPTSLTDGLTIILKVANNSTIPNPTLNVNGLGDITISNYGANPLLPYDMVANDNSILVYNASYSQFELQNPGQYQSIVGYISQGYWTGGADSGTANAYVMNTLAGSGTYQFLSNGSNAILAVTSVNSTNTGAATLTVNGESGNIVLQNGSPLSGGEMIAGGSYLFTPLFIYGTWQLLNPSRSVFPTVQVFDSGSGTYTPTAGVTFIKAKLVGGGGAGEGSGTSPTGTAGGDGGNTTFGTATAVGGKGGGGVTLGIGGVGGGDSGSSTLAFSGANGGGGENSLLNVQGGLGGGAGGGFGQATPGIGGNVNQGTNGTPYGAGGSGAGGSVTVLSGSGGGGGGYNEWWVSNPSTISYSVGAGGIGGSAGASGAIGGDGGAGVIIVEEYYN